MSVWAQASGFPPSNDLLARIEPIYVHGFRRGPGSQARSGAGPGELHSFLELDTCADRLLDHHGGAP